jgi:hypothetical protein
MSYTTSLYINNVFDLSKDVVITLDYSALSSADGGILLGVIPHYRVAPDGYSTGAGLGYSNLISDLTANSATGILDTQIGVALDFTGNFVTNQTGITGLSAGIPNSITLRGPAILGYPLLTTTNNISSIFDMTDGTEKRVRFRLSDLGNKVVVDVKDNVEDRVFTNLIDYRLSQQMLQYCRVYVAFTTNTSDTNIHVQNLNYNAHDVTMVYCLSTDTSYATLSPPCVKFNQYDTITIQNVNDNTGIIPSLGTLIYIINPESGIPYVGSQYISVTYTGGCSCSP